MQKVIIIPARMHSNRFPGKVLYPINEIPMIVRTAHAAELVKGCTVYVASDDATVLTACANWGLQVVPTKAHNNGTERCAEAARILQLKSDDCVLNLQADLPYIDPALLEQIMKLIPYYIVTAAVHTEGAPSIDRNLVKMVLDRHSNAMYFSRAPIPVNAKSWYNHIGVYGFSNYYLQMFAAWPDTELEQCEDLEQLRILYRSSMKMKVVVTDKDCISINVPSDLDKLKIYWPKDQVTGHVI